MTAPGSWVRSRPPASIDAQAALRRWWSIDADVQELPSERDRNVLVRGADGRPAHVLKIANLAEDAAFLECQHGAMTRLARAGVPVAALVPASDGRELVGLGEPGPPWARLLTWMPGATLASVTAPAPALWRDLGAMMGRSAGALVDYAHPAARRSIQWDVQQAGAVIAGGLAAVGDPDRSRLLDAVLERITPDLVARLPGLRRSVIHNDANDHNVLVDEAGSRIVGLLDFGDMVDSVTAQEAAVAAAYAMLGRPDPLSILEGVAAGFHATFPLRADEVDALPSLVLARLAMSVSIAAGQARLSDDPYLRVSEGPAWSLLERLMAVAPSELRHRLHEALRR